MDRLTAVYDMVGHEDYLFTEYKNWEVEIKLIKLANF